MFALSFVGPFSHTKMIAHERRELCCGWNDSCACGGGIFVVQFCCVVLYFGGFFLVYRERVRREAVVAFEMLLSFRLPSDNVHLFLCLMRFCRR